MALVATDLVDSTRIQEQLGDERAAGLWAEHDRATRSLLALHGGHEVDRTDGFFLMFDSAAAAARFVLDYQNAVSALGLAARAALHLGTVHVRRNEPEDVARGAKAIEVEGLAKPYVARLMALAAGGQTLLSAPARAALTTLDAQSPLAFRIIRHGHYKLKGIEQPVEVSELGRAETEPMAPPPDADKAYRVVADGELWRPVREVSTNLGGERDHFVGRRADLRALAERLEAGPTRLVTVVGPGGMGKTRLVSRYGRAWLGDWPGGVYFCDLSEARSLDGVLHAVAAALAVPLAPREAAAQLGHAIAAHGRCLVIFDNFEQVVAHARATVGAWLERSRDASFIVTSRERLHLPGETLLELEPLPLEDEAIELFAARAREHQAGFDESADREPIAEAVRLLDGLPLAIELAAARLRVMSPRQLVARLRDRFAVLAGARGVAARQATLRAAIDWSWQLLAPWEQAAMAQCATFEGGFTLAAAEAVLDLSAHADAPPVLDAVQSLVDKSLLRSGMRVGARRLQIEEPYFGMYLSIHEFAAERLRAMGEAALVRAETRHGTHYAGWGGDASLAALHGPGGVGRRVALAQELDNLVAACRRALPRALPHIAVPAYRAAWTVLMLQGPFALGVKLGAALHALAGLSAAQRVAVARAYAQALRRVGRRERAREVLEAALEEAHARDDEISIGLLLESLAVIDQAEARVQQSMQRTEQAVEIFQRTGRRMELAGALTSLATQLHDTGRLDEARARYEEALTEQRRLGDRFSEGVTLGNLATLYNDQGHLGPARRLYEQTIALTREIGDLEGEGLTLGNLGKLALDEGRWDEAREVHGRALAIARRIGHRRNEGVSLGQLGIALRELGRPDEARENYEAALAIACETGNRRFEGQTLANLAELDGVNGADAARARERMAQSEALLREIDDPLDLAEALCTRARIELALGDLAAARSALGEAQALGQRLQVQPASSLGQALAALGRALDG